MVHFEFGHNTPVEHESSANSPTAKSHTACQDFLTSWKDADPDIPILINKSDACTSKATQA